MIFRKVSYPGRRPRNLLIAAGAAVASVSFVAIGGGTAHAAAEGPGQFNAAGTPHQFRAGPCYACAQLRNRYAKVGDLPNPAAGSIAQLTRLSADRHVCARRLRAWWVPA
jgi:hypothetical protein